MAYHRDVHITISSGGDIALAEPAVFTAFDVQAAGLDRSAILASFGEDGAPADEDDHVYVTVSLVRRLAGQAVDAEWETGFAKMIEFAESHGWLTDDGKSIKAHIA